MTQTELVLFIILIAILVVTAIIKIIEIWWIGV